ncbi:MAG: leucine-rich repeat domain-containing protein [Paramuribaculum sp.]|nr:leucine-rich repeat domain-containing protein [Paramuribaculum sp.]
MKKLLLSAVMMLVALPQLKANDGDDFTFTHEGQTLTYTVISEEDKTCRTKTGFYEIINETMVSRPGNTVNGDLIIPATANGYRVVEIGYEAFRENEGLKSVVIPEGVTVVGANAFYECRNLRSVTLPEGLITISQYSLLGCKSLISITIPETVETIGTSAFDGSGLRSVVVPNSVTQLGIRAFCFCEFLESAVLPDNLTAIPSDLFRYCNNLSAVDIPEGITSIGPRAFEQCMKLNTIQLGAELKEIGEQAFLQSALTEVDLPEGLETIGNEAFRYSNLERITLPSSLISIGDNCFSNLWSIGFNTLDNLETIGANTFQGLAKFTISPSVKYISDRAFGDNIKMLTLVSPTPPELRSERMGYTEDEAYNILVLVPENSDDEYKADPNWKGFNIVENKTTTRTVYMSGEYPLAEEIRMQTGEMPGAITRLTVSGPLADDDWTIIRRNLVSCYSLDLSGVSNNEIPAGAFRDNAHLLDIKLPEKTKTIGDDAFNGCINTNITSLPDGIESIGQRAFLGCRSLQLSTLPASLRSIGAGAFYGCRSLQIKSLPAVEDIGPEAFEGCTRLIDMDMSEALFTELPYQSFSQCTKLRNVTLPATLVKIGDNAFYNTSVNFIAFPKPLTSIGQHSFEGANIISADLPSGITEISGNAFASCTKLVNVNLSNKLTTIGESAFVGCNHLAGISVPAVTPPTVGENAFSQVPTRDCVVSIPVQSFRKYLNAPGWGAFTQLTNSLTLQPEQIDENGETVVTPEGEEDDIEISAVETGKYEETVESITEEQEQEAEDRARDENFFGTDEEETEPASRAERHDIEARVAMARAEARANTSAVQEKALSTFVRIDNGSQMTVGENNNGYVVRVAPKPGVEIIKIEYNGQDVTDRLDGELLRLPAISSSARLKIYRKGTPSGISNVKRDEITGNAPRDVYSINGMLIKRAATDDDIAGLAPGIYIIGGKKVLVN